jgi:hypothetical protein
MSRRRIKIGNGVEDEFEGMIAEGAEESAEIAEKVFVPANAGFLCALCEASACSAMRGFIAEATEKSRGVRREDPRATSALARRKDVSQFFFLGLQIFFGVGAGFDFAGYPLGYAHSSTL